MWTWIGVWWWLGGAACVAPRHLPEDAATGSTAEAPMNEDAARGVTDPTLRRLLSDHWEATLAASPLWATRLGDHRWDDQLGDASPAGRARDRAARDGFLTRARALDRATLSDADALHLDLFVELLAEDQATDVCHNEWWGLSARENPLATVNDLPDTQPTVTVADGVHLVARYRRIPQLVQDWTDNLRLGIRAGYTPEVESTRLVARQLHDELALADIDLTLAAPLREDHPGWSPADLSRFRADMTVAVAQARVALSQFATFVDGELLPAARPADRAGIRYLPEGEACYAALVRRETSLPWSAERIHQVGLDELDRIHAEMRVLGSRLFGTDDLPTIYQHLRADPALRFASAEEVESTAAANLARAKAAIPAWFGRLPTADCVVKPIPGYLAPYTYIAYYNPAVPDGSQPGEYRVNLYAPETRPRFEAAALAAHESIPGHHLQIALAQEMTDLPAFRRNLGWNAYVEGWALYAERLADEMGLYQGDLDRMGMLSFDAWRATRLVVDTGIHAQGWTREQAVTFFLANTPLAENNVRNEVDRYITWPGQALSYKLGQMEILALRRDAEARLGPRFDVRGFHDVVLGAGAVSLPVLDRRVQGWVESRLHDAGSPRP